MQRPFLFISHCVIELSNLSPMAHDLNRGPWAKDLREG